MRLLVLLPLLALAGCALFPPDDPDDDVACLTVEVQHDLAVLLPDGAPADSVEITATNERTGAVYGPCDGASAVGCSYTPGQYVVYSDGLGASPSGDDVTVRGTRGELAFEAAFRFARGVCHVQKVAGPDTVTLR